MRSTLYIGLLCIVMHLIGIVLFSKGFFLTRLQVSQYSVCQTHLTQGSFSHPSSFSISSSTCHPRVFSRTVVLVVDALRHDFVVPEVPTNAQNQHYNGRLKTIRDTVLSKPRHCFLAKFIADTPTVTMQRLKALTTGGMPTFVDLNDLSFASAAITEDNIVHQLRSHNVSRLMVGDDTWIQLFPTGFDTAFPFPSFDAMDLHTVDNGVLQHLEHSVQTSGAEFIVAHMLGVDHVGHKYGPQHSSMAPKLKQVDDLVSRLIDSTKEDELLLVFGDHGMTEDGNHGGASFHETDSILFAYTGSPVFLSETPQIIPRHSKESSGVDETFTVPNRVSQIDLLPTLSLLLGLPIPFSNLGKVIPHFLDISSIPSIFSSSPPSTRSQRLLIPTLINAHQVFEYLQSYVQASPAFSSSSLSSLFSQFETLNNTIHAKLRSAHPDDQQLDFWNKELDQWLESVQVLCREKWAAYDLHSMRKGLLFTASSTILIFVSLFGSSSLHPPALFFLITAPILEIVVTTLLGPDSQNIISFAMGLSTNEVLTFILAFVSILWMIFSIIKSNPSIARLLSQHQLLEAKAPRVTLFFVLASVALHAFSLTSNSFVEAEENVVLFLTTSILLFLSAQAYKDPLRQNACISLLLAAGAARLSSVFFVRTPDDPNPTHILFIVPFSFFKFVLSCSTFTSALVFSGLNLKQCLHNPRQKTVLQTLSVIVYSASLLALFSFLFAFFVGDEEEGSGWTRLVCRIWVPRVVFVLCVGSVFVGWLGLRTRQKFPTGARVNASLIVFTTFPIASLVAGPENWGSVGLCVLALLFTQRGLLPVSLQQRTVAEEETQHTGPGDGFQLQVLTCLLVQLFFFGSGHDTSFNTIQFESAFLGVETFNYWIGGALVFFNTFGSLFFGALISCLSCSVLVEREWPKKKSPTLVSLVFSASLTNIGLFATNLSVSTVFIFVHRHHLMLWRVFAPKFVFDVLFSLLSILSCFCLSAFVPLSSL